MSIDLTAAIDAGAKALWDFAIEGDHADPSIDTWDEGGEEDKQTLRDGIRAVLEVAAPLLEKALRESIGRDIEVACGLRCPTCQGKPGSSTVIRGHYGNFAQRRCGGGHTWTADTGTFPGATMAVIARGNHPGEV